MWYYHAYKWIPVITNELTLGIAMRGQNNSAIIKPKLHKYIAFNWMDDFVSADISVNISICVS